MSTVLQQQPQQSVVRPSTSPSQRLRTAMAAARVSLSWFGVRKTLTAEQRAQAADTFGAEGAFVSAGKKLLDTRHPAFQAVTAVRTRAVKYWKELSLPYPEPGLRLIRQDAIDDFDAQMTTFRSELDETATALNRRYEALKVAAQQRLGRLFNPADYPLTLEGLFKIEWDFPSVEPPNYLRDLHPDLYEQECERVAARFDEAVRLAEQAFIEELHDLVSHLTERLTGQTDGRPKVFRDSIVGNLTEFFQRFQQLNVRSNDDLDRLVEQCQGIVRGVEPQLLRDNQGLRQQVATELTQVENVLDSLLVNRPRRNILRRPK